MVRAANSRRGIVKAIQLDGEAEFEGRGEFFNALNHTNLGTPTAL